MKIGSKLTEYLAKLELDKSSFPPAFETLLGHEIESVCAMVRFRSVYRSGVMHWKATVSETYDLAKADTMDMSGVLGSWVIDAKAAVDKCNSEQAKTLRSQWQKLIDTADFPKEFEELFERGGHPTRCMQTDRF